MDMKVLRFFYAECIIPEENSDKFYLLTLEREDKRFTVRGRFGRRTSEYGGQGTIKYLGESHAEAEKAFEKTITDRQKHGYKQEILPNVLRHELAAAGLDPTLIEPILARAHFRPLARRVGVPAGSLVSLGQISSARPTFDEMVVRIDAAGNRMAVSCEGISTSPTAYSALQSIADAGMAPATLVLGRSEDPKLPRGQFILLDVLEVSGSPVDDLPGSERIMLLADLARLTGLPVPAPVRAAGLLPAGSYLISLDQPHRCADGSPSRFVITA